MYKLLEFYKLNKDDIVKPVSVLLAICIIIPLALSLTNKITADRIARLEVENQAATMSQLVDADKFEEKVFKGNSEQGEVVYYSALKDDKATAFIFITSAKGYGGEISVMTAVNTDKTVKSVAILDASNETPGLGQNVTNADFYSQFNNKKSGITVVKNSADSENNEIDAVTGATISSKAVTNAVNTALEQFELINSASKTEVVSSEK